MPIKTKHFTFKVIKQNEIPFDFTIDETRKFPVHEHYLTELQEILVLYKYRPSSNLDEEKYIEFIAKKLKKKYNAYSVVLAGSLQDVKRV